MKSIVKDHNSTSKQTGNSTGKPNRKPLPDKMAVTLQHCHRRSWPVWLTAEEVAELLRVDVGTVYSLARQKILPHVKIGRIYRFDRDGMFFKARGAGVSKSRESA